MTPTPKPGARRMRWRPDRTTPAVSWPVPRLADALGRGLCMRCPACGQTKLFTGYLKVTPVCGNCGAPLGSARADDAPPYFTVLIVGHLVVPSMWAVERAYAPAIWVQVAVWVPLTIALTLGLLRPVKGATVGLMLKLGMLKSSDEA